MKMNWKFMHIVGVDPTYTIGEFFVHLQEKWLVVKFQLDIQTFNKHLISKCSTYRLPFAGQIFIWNKFVITLTYIHYWRVKITKSGEWKGKKLLWTRSVAYKIQLKSIDNSIYNPIVWEFDSSIYYLTLLICSWQMYYVLYIDRGAETKGERERF